MKNQGTLLLIGCLVCWGACLTPKAKAGDWDQKPVLTFSQPVEIPGIVLPAGTYVFSFLGSTADRNLIDVLSQDEQKVYATIEAIPDYRANAVGGTSIVFEERKAGAPHAIKEWFFPDRRYGHEFVYPGMGVLELGEFNNAGVTMAHSGQMMAPEEGDYLRLLHAKQKEAFEITSADQSAKKPMESGALSYLQALHQKQREAFGVTKTDSSANKPVESGSLSNLQALQQKQKRQ
jgi:hypothetical protein